MVGWPVTLLRRRDGNVLHFVAACAFAVNVAPAGQDAKQPDPKKTPPKFDPPKIQKPDDATLKQIAEKTEQLRKAIDALKAKKISDDVLIEVEIYRTESFSVSGKVDAGSGGEAGAGNRYGDRGKDRIKYRCVAA